MSRLALALAAFIAFTAYTISVAAQHSLLGFLADHARGGWSLQIFVDLCVAAVAFWVVGISDARSRAIRAWPYVVLTPLLGSIAILAYLLHRTVKEVRLAPRATMSRPAE